MAVNIAKADLDELEGLVDRYSLTGVVEALAQISFEKADHIRTNWQDQVTAREWDRSAKQLDAAASKIMV